MVLNQATFTFGTSTFRSTKYKKFDFPVAEKVVGVGGVGGGRRSEKEGRERERILSVCV